MNLAKPEDDEYDELELVYDDYIEKGDEVDAYLVQEKLLVIRRAMITMNKEKKEDWR